MNIKIVNNAKDATGLAVIIDVFRAFTLEPYLIHNGAKKIIPVGDMQIAYDYKKKDSTFLKKSSINLVGCLLPHWRIWQYFSKVSFNLGTKSTPSNSLKITLIIYVYTSLSSTFFEVKLSDFITCFS